jgi:hypothetical protein
MKKQPTPRSHKTTTILYLRVSTKTHEKIARIARRKGWPHTIASVAQQGLDRSFR